MKKRTKSVLLILILITLVACQSLNNTSMWETYKSEIGGFSVQFPDSKGNVKEIKKTGIAEGKSFDIFHFMVSKEIVYDVWYSDISDSILNNTTTEKYLDTMVNQLVTGINGKLLNQSVIKLGDYEGREVKLDAPSDLVVVARTYIAKDRVYCAIISTNTENSYAEDVHTFLNSFRIIGK